MRPDGYWFWISPKPTMREIAAAVADRRGITLADIRGHCRERQFAWPRQEAYALIHATGCFSLPQIGRFFGKFDHTAVWHGIRAHNARSAQTERKIAA